MNFEQGKEAVLSLTIIAFIIRIGVVKTALGALQVLVTKEVAEEIGGLKDLVPTGTSVLIEGHLEETPPGTKQVRA